MYLHRQVIRASTHGGAVMASNDPKIVELATTRPSHDRSVDGDVV